MRPLLILSLALVLAPAWAQPVRIPVTVIDHNEQFVRNLTAANFRVTEDGREQKVESAEIKADATSLGIVSDRSRSMESVRAYDDLAQGLTAMVQTSNPSDEFFVVVCAHDSFLACDFTRDAGRVVRAFTERARGGTALWDSLYDALTHTQRAKNARRAVVVVSDGNDNNSQRGTGELEELVRRTAIPIFFLNVGPGRNSGGPAMLRVFAVNSGGWYKEIRKKGTAGAEIQWIGDFLRTQYTLSFTSTNTNSDVKWRKLRVEAVAPGAKLKAVAPAGYLTSSPGR